MQMTLMDDLTDVAESIMPLMEDIDSLAMAEDPFGVESALIADYFEVNDTEIRLFRARTLLEFCIPAQSVLKFEFKVTVR